MASLIKSVFSQTTTIRKLLSDSFIGQINSRSGLHSVISQPLAATQSNPAGNSWSLTFIRTNVRDNWPRPNERKRLKLSFWNRMKTRGGRAIIMRRYLKGRHVLSH